MSVPKFLGTRIAGSSSILLALTAIVPVSPALVAQDALAPKSMKVIGEVDPRYVSYNVEAVEVTGGRFWAPYSKMGSAPPPPPQGALSVGQENDPRFHYRPPIDLSNGKLRNLAAALGPAFVRVSGTWRNATYFQNDDNPPMKAAPKGFQNVLTRAEWKGVVDFAHAVHGDIVASVTTSEGVRDKDGVWTDTQAKAWFDYTKSIGGSIAAMEFMNEPTIMALSGAPDQYGAAEYGRDSKLFGTFLHKQSPATIYLGPSSTAEGLPGPPLGGLRLRFIPSESLLKATGPLFAGFSYHVYYAVSHRCMGANGTDVKTVLDPEWFQRGEMVEQFYARLRDQYLPGKPLWLTETGEASCGGDTWASSFVDTFRLLDQLGNLAQHSVQSVMINTLVSSDYGLIDENTLEPRPNYWAALLWKRTMGTKALDSGIAGTPLRVYSQCTKDTPGGVSVLVLNVDKNAAHSIKVPISSQRFTLSSTDLLSQSVLLNGQPLQTSADGKVPAFVPEKVAAGVVSFAPLTVTVLTIPSAANPACRR